MNFHNIKYSFSTNVGKVRKENQDSYGSIITQYGSLFLVCDGMGGVSGGAMASILATEVIINRISRFNNKQITPDILSDAIRQANSVVNNYGNQNPGFEEMGTTVLAFYCNKDNSFVCHVGDSRLYKISNGSINQLTKDHTWVQELIDSGAMNADKAEKSPVSHLLTRALGTRPEVEVEMLSLDSLEKGELYLLCTDGLYNSVSDETILSITSDISPDNLDQVVEDLVSRALVDGGKDNITVAAVLIESLNNTDSKDKSNLPLIELSGSSGVSYEEYLPEDSEELSTSLLDVAEETIQDESFSEIYERKYQNRYLFRYFLLGILASIVIFLTLAINDDDQENLVYEDTEEVNQELEEENKELQKVAKDYKPDPRIQKIKKEYERRKQAEIKSVFSLSRSPLSNKEYLNSYLEEVKDNYFHVPPKPPIVILPKIEQNGDSKPVRPIVWENEARLMQEFKQEFRKSKSLEDEGDSNDKKSEELEDSSGVIRSEGELYSIIYDKESIRTRINDIDEKIRKLGFRKKEKIALRKKDKEIFISILNEKIDEINLEYERLKNRAFLLDKFKSSLDNSNLELLTERLLVLDPDLSEDLKKIRSVREKLKQTKKIFNVQEDQISLANKIATLNRELSDLQNKLKIRLENIINEHLELTKDNLNKLMWISYVLELERNSQARALGFLSTSQDLSPRMVHDLHEVLIEERQELYSELLELKKIVSDKKEFKMSLAEFKPE